MNLLFDCRPVRDPVSGVARYCIGLSNSLANKSINLRTLVQGGGRNSYISQLNKINIKDINPSGYKILSKFQNISSEYFPGFFGRAFVRGEYDIVHETYFANIGPKSSKKIATIHDVFPIDFPWMFSKVNVRYSTKNFYRQVIESDAIIAVSEYTKNRIVDLVKINPDKISVVGNAVSSIRPNIANISASILDFVESKRPYFFFIGNVEPRKNLHKLIEAFGLVRKDFPDFVFVCAGKSNFQFSSVLNSAAEFLGEQFLYLGSINEDEKWYLMENMDFLVFPSLCEGFGIPVIEAYSIQKPVIFSKGSALSELSYDDIQLFNPENVDSIADKLRLAILDSSRLQEIAMIERIYHDFSSWAVIADKTMRVYEDCLK